MRKCLKQRWNDRAVENFLSLYEKHKKHLDAHFVSEICTGEMQKIDARVWELLLCEYFTEQKLDFISPDHGPDFKIQSLTGNTIWVEAICPNMRVSNDEAIINYLQKSEKQFDFVEVPEESLDLVITSAIKEKKDKFNKYITDGIVGENDIMLVALSSASTPMGKTLKSSYGKIPRVAKTAYGIGRPYVSLNTSTDETTEGIDRQYSLQNHNDSPVETAVFLTEEYRHISAVFSSNQNIMETHVSDMELVHNIKARNGLPLGQFSDVTEWYVENNKLRFVQN